MNDLFDIFVGVGLPLLFPLSISSRAIKMVKKMIIEDKIKGADKKDLFEYLIQNRIFIDSLTDEELKRYKKTILSYYRARLKSKIRRFFKLEK